MYSPVRISPSAFFIAASFCISPLSHRRPICNSSLSHRRLNCAKHTFHRPGSLLTKSKRSIIKKKRIYVGTSALPNKLSASSWIYVVFSLSCGKVIELIQDTCIQHFFYLINKRITLHWIQWLYYFSYNLSF